MRDADSLPSLGCCLRSPWGRRIGKPALDELPYGNLSGTNFDFVDDQRDVQTEPTTRDPPVRAVRGARRARQSAVLHAVELRRRLRWRRGLQHRDAPTRPAQRHDHEHEPDSRSSTSIDITEGGDIILTDVRAGGGTAVDGGGRASLSGTVQILAALDTSVIGNIVNFGGGRSVPDHASRCGSPGLLIKGLQPAGTFGWQRQRLDRPPRVPPRRGRRPGRAALNNIPAGQQRGCDRRR